MGEKKNRKKERINEELKWRKKKEWKKKETNK